MEFYSYIPARFYGYTDQCMNYIILLGLMHDTMMIFALSRDCCQNGHPIAKAKAKPKLAIPHEMTKLLILVATALATLSIATILL